MKYKTQCLAVLLTTASATLTLASPCSCIHPAPVRERVMNTYPSARRSDSPLHTASYVILTPFRLMGDGLVWTGRAMGGHDPAPVGERRIVKEGMTPSGERFAPARRTHETRRLMPVGEKKSAAKTAPLKKEQSDKTTPELSKEPEKTI